MEDREYMGFKILVVGEPGVGKTSLVNRYTSGVFTEGYKSTIGVDFASKNLTIVKNGKKIDVELAFWDLAGQERIGTQINVFFRETNGVLCLFDVTRPDTYSMVPRWKQLIDERVTLSGNHYTPPSILIANKIDLMCDNIADYDLQNAGVGMGFLEVVACSIARNVGLDTAVEHLVDEMYREYKNGTTKPVKEDKTVELGIEPEIASNGARCGGYC